MVVHVLNISFTYTYTYIILIRLIMFHFILSFIYTFLIVLITVYISSHNNAMFIISSHLSYSNHLHAFMFHSCIHLRSGYGKELYVLEGTITVRDSGLYLYDPNGAAIMIKIGSMPSTQTGL